MGGSANPNALLQMILSGNVPPSSMIIEDNYGKPKADAPVWSTTGGGGDASGAGPSAPAAPADVSGAGADVGGPVGSGASAAAGGLPPWLAALSKVGSEAAGITGKMLGGGGSTGPGMTPGVVGQQVGPTAPPAMAGQPTPSPMAMNRGTGPGSGMPLPVAAVPGRPGYQGGTGTEGQFMSQLTPQAAGLFQGIQGFQKVMADRQQREDQKDSAEAANVAQNFMKALDTAQNSPDERTRAEAMQTVDMILSNKEYSKVLNKVYKGWLQKADQQKKAKSKEPDPETAGFEKGLQDYFAGKGALPQMPNQLQGYRLPSAGPAQQIGNIQKQVEAARAAQDPLTQLQSQLTSGEMRETELGATTEKLAAERARYKAETDKAQSEVLIAGMKVNEEKAKLQTEQAKTKYAQMTGEKAAKLKDIDYQKALVNLDIYKTRLALAKIPKQTGQPPPILIKQTSASQQAIEYIDSILADPERAKKGFNQTDIVKLTGLLQQAGASGLVKDLPNWMQRHVPDWLGGSGSNDIQTMRDSIQYWDNSLSNTIQSRYPNWEGPGSVKEQGGILPPAGEFGMPPGYEGPGSEDTSEGGEIQTPEKDIGLPPGFVSPPRNE